MSQKSGQVLGEVLGQAQMYKAGNHEYYGSVSEAPRATSPNGKGIRATDGGRICLMLTHQTHAAPREPRT